MTRKNLSDDIGSLYRAQRIRSPVTSARAKLANFGIAVAGLIVGLGAVAMARADNQRPTEANVEYAKGVAQLLQNEMIAALLQEFNETTAANASQGKVAIGLIFNDANRAIRLIGNTDSG
jgi:hypothetical protein